MLVAGRLVVFCFLTFSFDICASVNETKHGFNMSIIKYKQYVDVGKNKTQLLPPIVIIPVLFENSNNETSISTQKDTNTLYLKHQKLLDDDNDIEVSFRQSLNRGMGFNNKSTDNTTKENINLSDGKIENKTDIIISTQEVTKEENDASGNITSTTETTTLPEGIYPASNKSEVDINSISLTITPQDPNLPPINDNRWQNFTVSTNLNFVNETSTKEPDSRTFSGPYSAARYNNRMIDQISITTNSYTNEESPLPSPKNDRWRTFSQKPEYSANQFKPLAGLYYDGFLHKPLIMLPGFIPRNYYNLY